MSTVGSHIRGFFSFAIIAFALTLVGCVGPMACPPGTGCGSTGCDGGGCDGGSCGPFAMGCGGQGCGDCSGCGELYIDPWINSPADTCDPCDMCGNHNGQSCGKCRSVFDGAPTMWGYRCGSDCGGCDDTACDAGPCSTGPCESCVPGILNAVASVAGAIVGCGTCGEVACGCDVGCDACGEVLCGCEVGGPIGCDACGEATCGCDGGGYALETFDDGQFSEGQYYGGQPTPISDGVADVAPAEKPYKPSRKRTIFQKRPDVAEAPNPSNY